ncbi:hypothetical protein V1512DRAFT_260917, partial [Lipomyces arxii]|uniref:uncharacterized protein n=1 Tax=Lipomyces arxii TaxID=56418 RepID=UPI0034CD4CAE
GFPNPRRIFSSFRTDEEERQYSRQAFLNLVGFLGSCLIFSFVAQKLSGLKGMIQLPLAAF